MRKFNLKDLLQRYAIMFFLATAIYGCLSSFMTVKFLASSIHNGLASNVFYAAGGPPMSNAVEYYFNPSYEENKITYFYNRPVSLKMNTIEVGYLTDNNELNDATIESDHMDIQLKKVSNRASKPTTLPPTTPPPSYSSSIKSVTSRPSSHYHDTSSTQSKYSKSYTRSPSQRSRQRRKYTTRKPRIESNPLYPVAMSRRRNYTFHYPMGSTSFKREARINLWNTTSRGLCEEGHCIKYISIHEVPFDYSTNWQYHPDTVDITMIATATYNRMQFFPSIFQRWGGPVCVAIWAREEELKTIQEKISSFEENDKMILIIYHVPADHPNYYDFPVNLLRNICIRNIQTSHFMFLDIDMWPTSSMYQHLLQFPSSILESPTSAIIIPPIFLNSKRMAYKCRELDECFAVSREVGPETRKELDECVESKQCLLMKEGGFAHMFITKNWVKNTNDKEFFTKVLCFPERLQEPYLVLKYTSELPLFDERFVNYGYNKIQYIEQLRFYIDNLYILTQDFALDMYHQKSSFAKKFKAFINTMDKPEMDTVWQIFRNELRVTIQGKRRKIPTCTSLQRLYDFSKSYL